MLSSDDKRRRIARDLRALANRWQPPYTQKAVDDNGHIAGVLVDEATEVGGSFDGDEYTKFREERILLKKNKPNDWAAPLWAMAIYYCVLDEFREMRELSIREPYEFFANIIDPDGTKPTKGVRWQEAQDFLERCRLKGDGFTSQADYAKRLGCAVSTIHKAIHNGPVELQEWAADNERGPSRLNVSPEAAAVDLETTPQSREPDPGDAIERADEDAALQYLRQEAEKAGPVEVARLDALDPAARRAMAVLVYRDPDKAEQIERYRRAEKPRPRD